MNPIETPGLMHVIRLGWPPTVLSPNGRKDRRGITKVRNGYKTAAFYAARGVPVSENAHLSICFFPPDNRRRDLDNMLGSIKAGLDGIALAAGVDDYGWSLGIKRCEPVKGGAVVITIGEPVAATVELRGTIG